MPTLRERFWAKVSARATPSGCWNWTAAVNAHGYGWFRTETGPELAHRVAWTLTFGPVADGLHVLHRCDNRRCVNPDHLFLGTNADNVADKVSKGRQVGQPGARNPAARLTPEQVAAIRAEYARGGVTLKQLGTKYAVHLTTVHLVVKNKKWKTA